MSASIDDLGLSGPIVRSAADATALGMAFLLETRGDGSRRFLFVGPRCLGVNGVTGEAVMADASVLYDMILPEHREAFEAAEAQAVARLEPFDVEVAIRRAGGAVRWHRFAALPRPQPDGAVLWDGLQIDVTDRRSMADELVEQRRRLALAVEATGMGVWEWDVQANQVVWSDHNHRLFGLEPGSAISIERFIALVHEEDRATVQAAFERARARPDGGDYSVEHRIVTPAGETRWILVHGRVSKNAAGETRLVVGTSLDVTDRKVADERRSLLMGELAHRAKNGIAVLMAIVSQTARGQETVEGFVDLIMARLQAMANSQDLATASGGGPVALSDVVGKALSPFGKTRVDIDPVIAGVVIRGEMAVGMGLLLHEMATNAVKYGALSTSRGRVTIGPEAAPEGRAAFAWRESGGPAVTADHPAGFGTRLLHMVLRPQGGQVQFSFEPDGFRAHVEFPTVR